MIGETKIKLSALCVNGGVDDWFKITFDNWEAGKIHLKSEWRPLMIPVPATPLINAAGVAINSLEELESERKERKQRWQEEQAERAR